MLTGVTADSPAYKEELFGPVATVYKVSSEDEAVARAVERGVAYLLGQQRDDGLWNTWQSSDDHPVEDCVAHITGAIAARTLVNTAEDLA